MIDEKKLIKELSKRIRTHRSTMEIIRDIIPLVESQPKVGEWIPCSRELPSSDGRFEVTIKGSKGKRHVEMCNYYKDARVVFGNEKWGGENVIAWRQRPEPYKGE